MLMKHFKKLSWLAVLAVTWGNVWAANIQWTCSASDPNPVPADGNIYYIDTAVTLTQALTITGTLRLDATGTMTAGFSVTNDNGGYLHIAGGTWYQSAGYILNGLSGVGTIDLTSGVFNLNSSGGLWNGLNLGSHGTLNISGGTLNQTAGAFVNGDGGSGTINLASGVFNWKADDIFRNGASSGSQGILNISGGIWNQESGRFDNGSSGAGTINLTSGAFNWNSGNNFINGFYAGSQGTLNISGGTWNQSVSAFNNGFFGIGTINLTSGAFNWNSSSYFYNGYNSGSQGTLTVSGGMWTQCAGAFFNGYSSGSQGTLTINGATWNQTAGAFFNGYFGAGTLELMSGAFNWNSSSEFYNCANSGSLGTLTISGGTWTQAAGYFYNGFSGNVNGTLTISGGTWNQTAGDFLNGCYGTGQIELTSGAFNWNSSGYFFNGDQSDSHGTLTISGGTWTQGAGYFYNGNYGVGTIDLTSGAFNWNSMYTFFNGRFSDSQGTLTVSGGTWTQGSAAFYNGNSGAGTIDLTSGAFNWNSSSYFYNGRNSDSQGTLTVSGGTWTQGAGYFYNGNSGVGTIDLTSGAFNWNSSSYFYNGANSDSQGTLTISGGIWTQGAGYFYNGVSGIGTLELTSGAFNWNSINGFYNGYNSGTQGILIVAGGIFNTGDVGTFLKNDGISVVTLFGGMCDGFTTNNVFNVIDGNFSIPLNSTLIIGSGKKLVIPSYVACSLYGISGNGSINIWGANVVQNVLTVDTGYTFTVLYPFSIPPTYTLKNLSSSTINIYDTLTVAGLLENGGTGTQVGVINVYKPGTLLIPSGTVINKNTDSAICIEHGGSILNYGGLLDTTVGTCTIQMGGTIASDQGFFNYNSSKITCFAGADFTEHDEIMLRDDLDLDVTWAITLPAIIRGNGRNINFLTGGALQINPGASLLLDGVILDGVVGNNIRCMDNSGTLSLGNVIWKQDGNYSFTLGSIDILGNVVVQGIGTEFGYASTMTSTIHHNATLLFDDRVTFSYLAASPNLIAMEDKNSVLAFDNAGLYAERDLRLTKGNVIFDNLVTLSAVIGSTIYLGDKTNYPGDSAGDIDFALMSGANVDVYGNFVVDNVNA